MRKLASKTWTSTAFQSYCITNLLNLLNSLWKTRNKQQQRFSQQCLLQNQYAEILWNISSYLFCLINWSRDTQWMKAILHIRMCNMILGENSTVAPLFFFRACFVTNRRSLYRQTGPCCSNSSDMKSDPVYSGLLKEPLVKKTNRHQRRPSASGNTATNSSPCAYCVRPPSHLFIIQMVFLSISATGLPFPVIPTIDL